MNNSKLENGEVIEKILEKLWWRSNKAVYSGERTKEKDILSAKQAITNALNQQRRNLIEKIKDEYSEFLYKEWVEVAIPHNFEAGAINCTAFDEFLTKLEK